MMKIRIFLLFFVACLFCLNACQSSDTDPAAVMDAYTEAINNHDVEAALALVAEDALYSRPNGDFNGKEEIRGFIEGLFARDVQVSVIGERQVNGEEVIWMSSVSLLDPENPNGPRIQLTNNSRSTIRNGLIVFHTAERAQTE
jgi:ketosteroid isomerase-like protein